MSEPKKSGTPFLAMFGVIGLLFITILIVAYYFTRKANPIMLDDQGRPQQTHRS